MKGRGLRRRGMFLGSVVVVGAFAFLLYGGIEQNLVYFVTPSELIARGAAAYDAPLRLGGDVKPGSVQWDAAALDLRFRLTDGESEVEVHSRGAPPQMFRDGMGVVVEGRFRHEGHFESTNLMVMHSNEYFPEDDAEGAHPPGFQGEGLPPSHPVGGG
jgi:cytochrome c-type biogenesis protein CcmE